MIPDCECVTTIAPPSRSTSVARFCGVHVLAGESSFGIAGRAGRARQRDLGVRHQLLVVLERVVRSPIRGAGPIAPVRLTSSDRPSRSGRAARRACRRRAWGSDRRRAPCGISVPVSTVELAGHQMAEPRRPRTVVGDPAEARNHRRRALCVAARHAALRLHGAPTDRTPSGRVRPDRRRSSARRCGRSTDTSLRGHRASPRDRRRCASIRGP